MGEPFEILIGPCEIYLAPVGTTFPDVDTVPGSDWFLLGKNGKRNMADGGVTITHEQTINVHRNAGSTGGVTAVRPEESLKVSFTIEDITLEQYAKALNNKTVEKVAAASGTPGYRKISLHQGPAVAKYAMLCRGMSPYGDGMNAQYQVPFAYQMDNPAPVFNKTDVASLKFTFDALEDPNATNDNERFGHLIEQDAFAI